MHDACLLEFLLDEVLDLPSHLNAGDLPADDALWCHALELLFRDVPAKLDVIPSPAFSEATFRSYQRYLADKIEEMPALLAAAEMSLGKTASSLTGAVRVLRQDPRNRILIVGPLEVARSTWPEEIEKWEQFRGLTYTVLVGDETKRKKALAIDTDVTIINRENLPWLLKAVGGKGLWRWNILIYDESSRLKGWNKRTKGGKNAGKGTKKAAPLSSFGVLAHVRSKFIRIILLSGTPSPNGVIDLGGQAFILDGGFRLGQTKQDFLDRWFIQDPYTYKVEAKDGAKGEIMERMKDVMIGLRAEDYVDLPPQIFHPVKVQLPVKAMREYREFKKTLVAEAYDVEAVSRGVLTNKLLQFCNGSLWRPIPHTDPPKKEVVHVHDAKLDALERIIEEAAGQNVLIAYSYRFDLDRIKKRYPNAVVFDEEPNFVKLWNEGKIQIGLAHPASIGHGLNLQFGGYIQIWFGLTWSLELWDQFNRRLARPGQTHHSVFIYMIIAEGTVDEAVLEALRRKGAEQDDITQAVRVQLLAA